MEYVDSQHSRRWTLETFSRRPLHSQQGITNNDGHRYCAHLGRLLSPLMYHTRRYLKVRQATGLRKLTYGRAVDIPWPT